MGYARFLIIAVLALYAGCNNSSKSDDSPLAKAIEEQKYAQERGDTIEHRKQARQAAISHMTKYFPEWSIQGVTLYSYVGNVYMVGVDGISGDKRQTLSFRVDLFGKDNGEMYWKTEYVPSDANAKPFDHIVEPYTLTERED